MSVSIIKKVLALCCLLALLIPRPARADGLPWWEWAGWPRVMAGLVDGK